MKFLSANVLKITKKKLDFGEETTEECVLKIKIAIFERSVQSYNDNGINGVQSYNDNGINGVQYDYLGLSTSLVPSLDCVIESDNKKYKINYIQNSKRYKQYFLQRVEDYAK